MSIKELAIIKAGLQTIAEDERPPLQPYSPLKGAPKGFPYGEYTLLPPEDARRIVQTKQAMDKRAQLIKEMETKAAELRSDINAKIAEFQAEQGYESLKQELASLTEKLSSEVESTLDRVGKALIEQGETVMTVIEETKKGTTTKSDVQKALVEAVKKYASKDVAGKILKASDEAIASIEDVKSKLTRRLVAWRPPQDLRKKVKQEVPTNASKQVYAQGFVDTIKQFFSKAVGWVKDAISGVFDKLSNLVSAVDQGTAVTDEIKNLLGAATTGQTSASKKLAYRNSQEIFNNRFEYLDSLLGFFGEDSKAILDQLVAALSDSEAFDNFKYINRTQDLSLNSEDYNNRRDFADVIEEMMGAGSFLDNLVAALSDSEAFDNFDYIARMNDIYFTDDGQAVDSDTYEELNAE